eukprot:jgi/Bigna1/69484/fgenesh1_pg.9_\
MCMLSGLDRKDFDIMTSPSAFISEPENIGHCLHRALVTYKDRPFMGYRTKESKLGEGTDQHSSVQQTFFYTIRAGSRLDYSWITFKEVLDQSSNLAKGLASLGIPRRAHVGICAPNCPEWIYADFACAFNDFICVGVHTSWPAPEVEAVCRKADLTCLCMTAKYAEKFVSTIRDSSEPFQHLKHLVLLDLTDDDRKVFAELRNNMPHGIKLACLTELLRIGSTPGKQTLTGAASSSKSEDVILDLSKTRADPTSTFTLIFSSGTSGAPKGIQISNKRWKKDAVSTSIAVTPNQRTISYMALAHGADRGIVWQTCFCGGSFGFASASNYKKFLADISCIKPEFFLGLSHTWNRFYYDYLERLTKATLPNLTEMIKEELQQTRRSRPGSGEEAKMGIMSNRELSRQISEHITSVPWHNLVDAFCETREGEYLQAMTSIRFRQLLGGNFQTVATGGAHTSDAVIDFMRKVCMSPGNEMRVFDSYGATEFPGISKCGAISPLVELKLRDLPEMGYTNNDRFLYPAVTSCISEVFHTCAMSSEIAHYRVAIEELKAAMKKHFVPRLKQKIDEELPKRSHYRTRLQEIIDQVSALDFRGLDNVFDTIMTKKKDSLRLANEEQKKRKKKGEGQDVESRNNSALIATLKYDLENKVLEIVDFVNGFRELYGEIRPRGEILVRMKDGSHTQSYWKDPVKSKAAWVQPGGWYCTGDVGEIEYNPKNDKQNDPQSSFSLSSCRSEPRVLRIVDRCKNMVELYIQGRSVWVAMQNLEQNVYTKARCVRQVCLVADRNQPVMVAIVIPSASFMEEWSKKANNGDNLTPKKICEDPTFRELVLKQLQAQADKNADSIKDYEVPKHVILDHEPWTTLNGCLSAVGKPKRGYLQSVKYITQLDLLYAKDEVQSEIGALIERPPSPSAGPASFRDRDGNGGGDPISRPRTPTLEERQHSREVHSMLDVIEACIEKCRKQVECEAKERRVFPKEFWSLKKHEYMKWQFALENKAAERAVNKELDTLKGIGKSIHSKYGEWKEVKQRKTDKCKKEWDRALDDAEKEVAAKVSNLVAIATKERVLMVSMTADEKEVKLERDPITGTFMQGQVEEELQLKDHVGDDSSSLYSLTKDVLDTIRWGRFRSVLLCAKSAKAGIEPYGEEQLRYEWNQQRMVLESTCKRYSVFCPANLTFQFDWCWPAEDIQSGSAPAPSIPVGNAEVWCYASGRLIEGDVNDIGKPRYHVLDAPMTTDISVAYQDFFDRIKKALVSQQSITRLPRRSLDASRALALLKERDPWLDSAISRDVAHWTHLRHFTKKEIPRDDTPIAVIMQSCVAYADRLALGMPNSLNLGRRTRSKLPEFAGIECPLHDGYIWLKYCHVRTLTERIAERFMELGLNGKMIGICGFNDFEFALSDLAVARVSSCSVGLHKTYEQNEVEKVLANCAPQALVVTSKVLKKRSTGWSIEELDSSTSVSHVVLMDALPEELKQLQSHLDKARASKKMLKLHSLLEFVVPRPQGQRQAKKGDSKEHAGSVLIDPYKCRGVQVAHPLGSPHKDVNLFTLMYTSGSSGKPKGVMVSTESFLNDMGEGTSASPLVTVSYIPLSHSSDRVKVWEFLGNGGRIGFAHYEASNWRAHEKSKKDGMLDSTGAENNVRSLFDQIRLLQPSAMSCPPRIWNGLFHIYQQHLKMAEMTTPQKDDEKEDVGDDSKQEFFKNAATEAERKLVIEEAAKDKIRSMFGERVMFLATGGAPTREEVKQFARSIFPDATFVDSYGTTECGAISSNGKPIWSKNVQVRLASRPEFGLFGHGKGEIQVKSPHTHVGYFKNPDKTKEAWLEGGWYATGDLGRVDEFGKLHILERISAVRGLKDGTIVFPYKLMTILERADWATQVVIDVRKDRDFLVGIVVVDPQRLYDFCRRRNVSVAKALEDDALQKLVLQELRGIPEAKPLHVCKLKYLLLTASPWTIQNKLLTGSHKKRVNVILRKYSSELEKVYGG